MRVNLDKFNDQYYKLVTLLKRMDYDQYLNTEHWQYFRDRVLRHYRKCQRCGESKKLHVHHKNYRYRGQEQFPDIELLCKRCHKRIHGRS